MFRVSCIQLCSSDNVIQNLKKTKNLFLKAIKQKTDFILTPEVSSKISLNKKKLMKVSKVFQKKTRFFGISGKAVQVNSLKPPPKIRE